LFAQGDAADLKNPDGRAGVSVHFDAGFEPLAALAFGLGGATDEGAKESNGITLEAGFF